MSNGAGIQELMAAETRASQIVAEARLGEFKFYVGYLLLFQNEWMYTGRIGKEKEKWKENKQNN